MSHPHFCSQFPHPADLEFLHSLKTFLHSCVPEQALCIVLLPETLLKYYQTGAQGLSQPSGVLCPREGGAWWIPQVHVLEATWEVHIAWTSAHLLRLVFVVIRWMNKLKFDYFFFFRFLPSAAVAAPCWKENPSCGSVGSLHEIRPVRVSPPEMSAGKWTVIFLAWQGQLCGYCLISQ